MFKPIAITLQNVAGVKTEFQAQHMVGTGLGFIYVKALSNQKVHYRVMHFSSGFSIGPDWPKMLQAKAFVKGLTVLLDWTLYNPNVMKPWEVTIQTDCMGGKLSDAINELKERVGTL